MEFRRGKIIIDRELSEIDKLKPHKVLGRKEFIKLWAEFVRTHPDREWSRQQNRLINSQIMAAREFWKSRTKEEFLRVKEKVKQTD